MREEALSEDELAQLIEFREHILTRALSVERCDRPKAEKAYNALMVAMGFEPAKNFIWVDSPLQMHLAPTALNVLEFTESNIQLPLIDQLGDQIKLELRVRLSGQLRSELQGQLCHQLRDQIKDQLWAQIRENLKDELPDQPTDQLTDQLHTQLRSQLWCELVNQLQGEFRSQLHSRLWCQLSNQLTGQLKDQLESQLGRELGRELWGKVKGQIEGQLWTQLMGGLGSELGSELEGDFRVELIEQLTNQLNNQLGEQVSSRLKLGLYDELRDELESQLDRQLVIKFEDKLREQLGCQLDQWHLQEYMWMLFASKLDGVNVDQERVRILELLYELGEHAFWVLPMENSVIMCDRPVSIVRDSGHNLHNDQGPAIEFADGWKLYAVRGVTFDEQTYNKLLDKTFTIEDLNGLDAEHRASAISMMSADLMLKTLNAQLINVGTKYALQGIDRPESELYRVDDFLGTGSTEYCLRMTHPSLDLEYIEFVEPTIGEKCDADLAQAVAFGWTKEQYLIAEEA